jgi:hypothetical protein
MRELNRHGRWRFSFLEHVDEKKKMRRRRGNVIMNRHTSLKKRSSTNQNCSTSTTGQLYLGFGLFTASPATGVISGSGSSRALKNSWKLNVTVDVKLIKHTQTKT